MKIKAGNGQWAMGNGKSKPIAYRLSPLACSPEVNNVPSH